MCVLLLTVVYLQDGGTFPRGREEDVSSCVCCSSYGGVCVCVTVTGVGVCVLQ